MFLGKVMFLDFLGENINFTLITLITIMTALRRIQRELQELDQESLDNCFAGPVEEDLFHWEATILVNIKNILMIHKCQRMHLIYRDQSNHLIRVVHFSWIFAFQ